MDDTQALTAHNLRFIEAFRHGSWLMLQPILSQSFSYLDGDTGEVWDMKRYIKDLQENPAPSLAIDQVVIHVANHTALVSARTSSRPDRHNRYVDTYHREGGEWRCVHACVWSLDRA